MAAPNQPFPAVLPPTILGNREFRDVRLTNEKTIKVTITETIDGARKWIRANKHKQKQHAGNLQVGIALHGDHPDVLTLAIGNKSLIVRLTHHFDIDLHFAGKLQTFLHENDNKRFVSYAPLALGPLQLAQYTDAFTLFPNVVNLPGHLLGPHHNLNFVLDAPPPTNWNNWPLTIEHILYTVTQSHLAYQAAISNLNAPA